MEVCVLNLVIYTLWCTKVWSFETEANENAFQTTPPPVKARHLAEHVSEMGRGIETIPKGNPHIKTLNLAYNHISALPDHVFLNNSYKTLHKIELYQNKIANVSLQAFKGLRQLKTVDMSDNNLTTLDPYTFKFNTKLEKLDLRNNRINFQRLQVFLLSDSLETLIVTHNKIEQIFELTFMGVPNVKNLMLDHNTIFMIAPNSFKPLCKLQYLSLSNTGVYRLSESMFVPSRNLPRVVDISETPLSKRFDPHLTKIKDAAVKSLISLDKHIFVTDAVV